MEHKRTDALTCSIPCQKAYRRVQRPEMVRAEERRTKARNAEAVRARKARWYQENAERLREKASAYYQANTERAAEWGRGRYLRDPEAARERSRQYRKANPGQCRLWNAEYRSRKSVHSERFDPVEIFERDGWVCGICEGDIDPSLSYPDPQSVSLDHVIPVSRGGLHTRLNAQASHLRCNLRKNVRVTPFT